MCIHLKDQRSRIDKLAAFSISTRLESAKRAQHPQIELSFPSSADAHALLPARRIAVVRIYLNIGLTSRRFMLYLIARSLFPCSFAAVNFDVTSPKFPAQHFHSREA